MKTDFIDYCLDIGVPETLREQIKYMYSVAREFLGEEIEDVFISDYVDQGGLTNYRDVSFFGKAKFAYFIFPNAAVCSIFGWKGLHSVVQASFDHFDFKKPNSASRLNIRLSSESLHGTRHNTISFSASSLNCNQLFRVYTEIILPHL